MVTLVNDQAKQITAAVAEADIVKVKAGQKASVTFPASSKTLSGKVTSVARQSTVSNNVVQYDVAVSLPTADSSIRLGQTGNVTITTASHSNVLYVPTSAVTTTGTTSTVTRRQDGTDVTVVVETGLVGTTGTEIVRGLSEGDQIVLPTGTTGGFTFPGAGSGAGGRSGSSASSGGGPR
jgi:multidrug efflux pump subunit AcrA (membrane-fusion protein)